MQAAIEVIAPGLLTTVQDVVGRAAFGHLGVPCCGSMDIPATVLANRLVGNPRDAAVLEVTGLGPTLRVVGAPRVIAITGADLSAALDDVALVPGRGVLARAGSVLVFGERRAGFRAYLAISGGIDVPPVLGSRATDLLSGFGGLEGRALRSGDILRLGAPGRMVAGLYVSPTWTPSDPLARVRFLPGPHADGFGLDALADMQWRVTERADRMGYRLEPTVSATRLPGGDVPSLGLPTGAVQVPRDGQPIVLMADHQPTGGYSVLATIIHADLPLLAQRGPGESVRFTPTTLELARSTLRQQRTGPVVQGDEGEFAASWA
jgi:biotin-dependent carboxylase-like uncharacterized protein